MLHPPVFDGRAMLLVQTSYVATTIYTLLLKKQFTT